MSFYTLYWKDGKREVVVSADPSMAYRKTTRIGMRPRDLSMCIRGTDHNYEWDYNRKMWKVSRTVVRDNGNNVQYVSQLSEDGEEFVTPETANTYPDEDDGASAAIGALVGAVVEEIIEEVVESRSYTQPEVIINNEPTYVESPSYDTPSYSSDSSSGGDD